RFFDPAWQLHHLIKYHRKYWSFGAPIAVCKQILILIPASLQVRIITANWYLLKIDVAACSKASQYRNRRTKGVRLIAVE
ncbi:MAG TPA: hypothetical protein VIH98_10215, partial [Xanthobacteraceae bacterium]